MDLVETSFPLKDNLKKDIKSLFSDLQKDTSGAYPPRSVTDSVGGVGPWLSLDERKPRFIGIENREIVGYIEVEFLAEIETEEKKEYWQSKFLDYDISKIAVLKRLVVSPRFQGKGIGASLISLGLEATEGFTPGLVVLEYLPGAIELYERMGAVRVAETKEMEISGFDISIYSYLFN